MAQRGRKRRSFPFEEARELIRKESLSSKVDFDKWHSFNKPSRIPKRPDRAYKHQWKGWSNFLGTNNPFPCVRRSFRPYKDARAFAHSLGLQNRTQWFDFCRDGKKPKDIPSRPDLFYAKSREWYTWREFLGYTALERLTANTQTETIIYVMKPPNLPNNVYRIGITNGGKSSLVAAQTQGGFTIAAMFFHDGKFDWRSLLAKHSTPYWHGSGVEEYVVHGVAEFLNGLSERLNRVP